MAAAYKSSTTANTGSTPAISLNMTMPAGFHQNDNLFAAIAVQGGSGTTVTPPGGWTQIGLTLNEGTDLQQVVYWRLCTGIEQATYTWFFSSALQAAGVMTAYSGGRVFVPSNGTVTGVSSAGYSVNTTAASNIIMGQVINSYTGLFVYFNSTYNTTGSCTTTAASGVTSRADTCTTATPFIEMDAQDSPMTTLAAGGSVSTVPTTSQSVKSINQDFFVEDSHGSVSQTIQTLLVEDTYQTTRQTTTASTMPTNPITVNNPRELIVMFVTIVKSAQTVSSISGGSLTWSLAKRQNAGAGSSEIWYALSPGVQSFVATITFSGSVAGANAASASITGADITTITGSGAIGAVAGAALASAAPSVNLTTTRNGSWVFACSNDPTANTAYVAGSSQTLLRSSGDSTNTGSSGISRQTNPTAASGTVITSNFTAPSANTCNIAAVEILTVTPHQLAISGTGT
jgi:hypothetical protein